MDRREAGKLGALKSKEITQKQKEQRINNYNCNPKLCKKCANIIYYNKRMNTFCSSVCAASFNTLGRRRAGKNPWKKPCMECGKETINSKWCSRKCHQKSVYEKYIKDWLNGRPVKQPKNKISNRMRRYILDRSKGKCSICNQSEWMGCPMPLLIDHKNGNPTDNSFENLRAICGNCDMLLPTYKGRNIGNGRAYRRKLCPQNIVSDVPVL